MHRLIRKIIAGLFAVIFCGGCGLQKSNIEEPDLEVSVKEQVLVAELKKELKKTNIPTKEEAERMIRVRNADNGFLFLDDGMYAIDQNGYLRKNQTIDFLNFDANGKYTSGNEELDKVVWEIIKPILADCKGRGDALRQAYRYVVENIRYVGQMNHNLSWETSDGEDGWMVPQALQALTDGYGNCYSYAAAFTALARNLGYQAYAVGGIIGAADQPHGWCEIIGEDGALYMNDPETEWAVKHGMNKDRDLFWKKPSEIGAETGLSYTPFNLPDERLFPAI